MQPLCPFGGFSQPAKGTEEKHGGSQKKKNLAL